MSIEFEQLELFATIVVRRDKGKTCEIGTPVQFKGKVVGKVIDIRPNYLLHIEIPNYSIAKEMKEFEHSHIPAQRGKGD